MRKNKKGFTLIELLAVIVILAIIALIATPIILGIVEDARRDSFMRSVELVINATDIDIFNKNYNDTYTYTINDGNVSNLEIGVKNTDGMNGSITYDKNGNDIYAIHNGKYCVIKDEGMKKAEIKDYVEGECELTIPTDASYFTYVEMLSDFRIVDVEKCADYFINNWSYSQNRATGMCNDTSEWYDGMTLTEAANANPIDYRVLEIVEGGAIAGTATNTVAIIVYSEEGPKDVVIPSKINGKEVVYINNSAFSELELTSIVIPNTIMYIGESAFRYNNLTSITLPESVEYVDVAAFEWNPIETVTIENDNVELGEAAFCDTSILEGSETYQKIYNINPSAFSCIAPG